MKKIKEPRKITFAEVLIKLEELRTISRHSRKPTPEQREVLMKARTGETVVSYVQLQELWEEAGWGKVAASTLSRMLRGIRGEQQREKGHEKR